MKITPIPRDKTSTAARFASGAGQGIRGLAQGLAAFQDLEVQREQLALAAQENQRRTRLLEMSLGRTSQAYSNQRFQQGAKLRQEDKEAREKAAAQRAQGSILDAMQARTRAAAGPAGQSGAPQPGTVGPQPAQSQAQSAIPPEIDAAFETIRNDPDLTPEDRSKAVEELGSLAAAGARDAASKEVASRLEAEVASGLWSPENGLGLQIDVDGDGKPDDWTDAPNKLLFLLSEGKVDPLEVAEIHEGIKRAGVRQRATMERRARKVMEAQTQLQAQAATMPPEAEYATAEVLSRYQSGEFGDDAYGEQEFQRELGAAAQGLVFIEGKGGVRYAVPYEQAAQAELDLKEPPQDPAIKLGMDIDKLAADTYPPLDPSARSDPKATAAWLDGLTDYTNSLRARYGLQPAVSERGKPHLPKSPIPAAREPAQAPTADPLLDAWLSPEDRAEYDKLSPPEQKVVRDGLAAKERGGR